MGVVSLVEEPTSSIDFSVVASNRVFNLSPSLNSSNTVGTIVLVIDVESWSWLLR